MEQKTIASLQGMERERSYSVGRMSRSGRLETDWGEQYPVCCKPKHFVYSQHCVHRKYKTSGTAAHRDSSEAAAS